METIANVLAENLRYWREQRNLTQEELAERSGVSQPTITSIENGRRWPGIETIEAVSKALDVDQKLLFSAAFQAFEPTVDQALEVITRAIRDSSERLSPTELAVIRILRNFDQSQMPAIIEMLQATLRAQELASSQESQPPKKSRDLK